MSVTLKKASEHRISANRRRPSGDKLRAIDLFAGCGGLTLGLKQAGFEVVAAVEIDDAAAETYRANHREVLLEHADIQTIAAADLMRRLGLQAGELDLLAGCPPCQGFSALRTRNGAKRNRDVRNDLVNEMLRFARVFRPKTLMLENVPKLRQHKSFTRLCDEFVRLGYRLTFDVKDASRYGVPQRRRRLILLGGRGFDIRFARERSSTRTVRDAIGDLLKPGEGRDALHNMERKQRSDRIERLIRDIPKDGGSRGDLPRARQLACHIKTDGFHDIYGRMAWDKVAPTITGGCFNPSKGRFLHPSENRPITLREAALLQTFPRSYFFDVAHGRQVIALLIGNALPPEFIKRHARRVRSAIERSK